MSVAAALREPDALTPAPPGAYPDDPEVLPAGAVVDGARATRDIDDEVDYVVVGSGASGATAALALAERGFRVALVEEGPWVRTREFSADLFPAMKNLFRRMGTVVLSGRSLMPILQGRCVGGSTTINSAIAWRTPDDVLHDWSTRHGLGAHVSPEALAPHFEALERELSVRAVADGALGINNALFGEAAARLGFEAQRIRRYDGGCQASAGCATGCTSARKLGMNVTFVPRALAAGARLYHWARVERVEVAGDRASGVTARMEGPDGARTLRLRARRGVLVGASAVQTPNVLRRSGLRDRALGRHFMAHPGVSMAGLFDREVHMDHGAAQGFNSLAFSKSHGIKLEAVALPPEIATARIPGLGPELVRRLADYGHMVIWAVVLRARAEGRVDESFGHDRVRYSLEADDVSRARTGLKILAEMMFAAGAREVWPGVHGMPASMTSPDELGLWDRASVDPRAYNMMASHLFGGARMGPDPRTSVVSPGFESHAVRGLYVVDSSVFPTNLGVNPQHTIMAMARLAADRIAGRPRDPG